MKNISQYFASVRPIRIVTILIFVSNQIFGLNKTCMAQIADSWSLVGDLVISAENTGGAVTLAPDDGILLSAPTISGGSRNSISASAVGASASFSNSSASSQDLESNDSLVGDVTLTASNFDSAVTLIGTVDDAVISGGHDNSISYSAVGATAQLNVTDDVLNGATVSRTFNVDGDITLYAENTGSVTLQTDIGTNGAGPHISGGTRNSISGVAIGASAGVSVLAIVDSGSYSSDISIGDGKNINVTAINSGDVTIGSSTDPTQPATLNGATLDSESVDGNISLMAIGASGSVSSTTVLYDGSADPNVTFGDVNFDVENTGQVTANVAVSDLSINGKNSVSIGAISSTMSYSKKFIDYSDSEVSTGGSFEVINFVAGNKAALFVSAGLSNVSITGGFGRSISANAIGGSASFALP